MSTHFINLLVGLNCKVMMKIFVFCVCVFFFKYVFICLYRVLVAACRIFVAAGGHAGLVALQHVGS